MITAFYPSIRLFIHSSTSPSIMYWYTHLSTTDIFSHFHPTLDPIVDLYQLHHRCLPCSLIWRICRTVSLRMAHLSGFTLKLSMSLRLAEISSANSSMYLLSCSRRLLSHLCGKELWVRRPSASFRWCYTQKAALFKPQILWNKLIVKDRNKQIVREGGK